MSLILTVANAQAATWTVTKTADTNDGVCNGDCSLREAIDVAVTGDIIKFSALFNTPQTITLALGTLVINEDLEIVGTSANWLTISGNNTSGVFNISFNLSFYLVNLSGMTIRGADSTGIVNGGDLTIDGCVITENTGFYSGGIDNNGTLTINNSTISENTGMVLGGGIKNDGTLNITNSTISNNTVNNVFSGSGGIYNSGSLTLINSTISGNSKLGADNNGGGIFHDGTTTITNSTITNNSAEGASSASGVIRFNIGLVTLRNTIIAANVNNSTQPDVSGSAIGFASDGFNFIGNAGSVASVFTYIGDQMGTSAAPLNPLLDALGNYGGMTATHRLQATSPAIDKGWSFGSATDQRGLSRPYDKLDIPNALGSDGSDIGAYELQFTVLITGVVLKPLGDPLKKARVLLTMANGEKRVVKTDRLGFYRFTDVASNAMYQVSVTHSQYEFIAQQVRVQEELKIVDFKALP